LSNPLNCSYAFVFLCELCALCGSIVSPMAMSVDEILNSHRTGRAVVCGILNVTPDSFSDGGKFLQSAAAIEHARQMSAEGADMIDIGAESTRPGSPRVPAGEQIARLRQVLPAIAQFGAPVSVDTFIAEVASFALDNGAAIINDIWAGRADPEMFSLAAKRNAPVVLMHMLGEPGTMQADPSYKDVVAEVKEFLRERKEAAIKAGIDPRRMILDPGIGFGKKIEHNLLLLKSLQTFCELGCPVMIGVSRKRFIGQLTGQDVPAKRVSGTIAASILAWQRGATIHRVHDVAQVTAALAVAKAITDAR
jgi:dihydropteroate synthase